MPWDVTSWYREQSALHTAQNGGEPLPALAFFHIPTPEFRLINENTDMYGRNGDGSGIGSAELNSGFLLSCVEMGDVMGLFVGHDHENDYIGQHFNVALAYGRVSGFNAYGGLPRGGRIIDLYENSRSFDTWISTPTGEELLYHYPIGISEDDINLMEYLPATSATPAEQGIAYTYYEGPYKNLKDFPHKGREVSRGTKRNFILEDSPAEDYYGYEFEGLIRIPRRDVYLMHITCDDGALLYIDGRLIVDNGEAHSMDKSAKGKVALEEGLHEIRVIYYEDCQGEGLQIEIESLNMELQPISDEMLFVKR
ncbi:MAG: metallophosphatase, partial [Alistipes sp.]|nr:metallophosphatase [Alistipes sp.]